MRLTWLLLLVGCVHSNAWVVRYCPDGREVKVLRPVVSNPALNRYLFDQRTQEICRRRE